MAGVLCPPRQVTLSNPCAVPPPQVTFVEQQKAKRRVKRDHVEPAPRHRRWSRDGRHQRAPIYRSTFLNDPSWPRMWYLVSTEY